MKTLKVARTASIAMAAVAIVFCGICFAGQKAEENQKTASKDVKKETMEAVRSIKKYSVKQRDKVVKDVKAAMEDLDERIDGMQRHMDKRWDEADQASREKMKKSLKDLREKRNELSEWYGGLKHSSADAWENVKKGFINGYEALTNASHKAENEFGKEETDDGGGSK